MAADSTTIAPPAGFELDKPATPELPDGFVLDGQKQQPTPIPAAKALLPPLSKADLSTQGSYQPSQFSSGLPIGTPNSDNPDYAFTKALSDPQTGIIVKSQKPFIPIPSAKVNPNDSKITAVGKEVYNIAKSIPEFIESPLGIATLPLAAEAQAGKVIAGAFGANALKNVGQGIIDAHKDWDTYTPAQKAVAVTDIIGNGAMAALLGKAALGKGKLAASNPDTAAPKFQNPDIDINQPPKPPTPPVPAAPVLPPTPQGEKLVTIQRADGSTYPASVSGKNYDHPVRGDVPSVARVVNGGWSHGMLGADETILPDTSQENAKAAPAAEKIPNVPTIGEQVSGGGAVLNIPAMEKEIAKRLINGGQVASGDFTIEGIKKALGLPEEKQGDATRIAPMIDAGLIERTPEGNYRFNENIQRAGTLKKISSSPEGSKNVAGSVENKVAIPQPNEPSQPKPPQSGFNPPPLPEKFNSLDDALKYRQAYKDAEIEFYKSLGLNDAEANKFFRAGDNRSNTDVSKIEEKLSPENLERLDAFSTGEGQPVYQWDRQYDPSNLSGETDKKTLSQNIVQNIARESAPNELGDKMIHAAVSLRQLKENGGTWSDVARALDSHTTRISGSQSDKSFVFKKYGQEIRDFADRQGIDLPQGDLVGKIPASKQPKQVSAPQSEPTVESVTPLDANGTPIEKPIQKFRVGRSPQLFSMVNKLEQTPAEKANGEQAVTVKNENTGETHVVLESDLKPVNERTVEQKLVSKKSGVNDKLKALGYTDSQISAMPKAGAKALADRGTKALVGMGAAVPSEFVRDYDRDVYGIAERVRRQRENAEMTAPTAPGKGIAPEASVDRGRQLLKAGANPEKVMADFEKTNRASSDDFAIVRAQGEVLARITNRTEENFGTDSPEYRAAYKTESDWAARTKALQTEWAKSGHAQQGQVDIDTGTFSGIKRAYREAHNGEELPKADEKKAQDLADENRRLQNENAELLRRLNDTVDKETKPAVSTPDKPPTIENTQTALSDYKGGKMTTPQVRAVWNYTKKNYINKGNADFGDIVQKVSTDLGIPFKDVANGLAQPKGAKKLTDELWRKQTDARRVSESAKRFVRQQDSAILGQAIPRLARLMFGLKVAGHGGVAFGTHAPMVGFLPKYTKTYFKDFGKMYKMVFSPAEYEMNVQSLRADPNFNVAQRAGLVNDPYKVEDFNNPDMVQNFGNAKKLLGKIAGGGNRGYFALKILRQDMFNQGWDKLPESIKTPEMAKAMADDINHITGVVKSGIGNKASLALFAPRLLMSRAAFLAGDLYKAVEIAYTAMSPKKWAALPPHEKFMVLNQVKQKATILATAYGLLLANKYLLQATGSKQQINLTDPTKSDFMKFKAAGMDFSYGNAMLNMARLPVRLWTIGAGDGGKLKHVIYPDESMYSAAGEFARSQASPLASLGLDFIFKGDYQNRPLPQIPGYGKPIPLPKRLAAEGIKPYTWPEYFSEQVLPIPLEEGAREVYRNGFHMTPEGMKSLAKAAGTIIVMAGTGGRLTEDLQPKKP